MPFLTVTLWAFWGKLSPHAGSSFLFSCPSSYVICAPLSPSSALGQPRDQMLLLQANQTSQCGHRQAPASAPLKRPCHQSVCFSRWLHRLESQEMLQLVINTGMLQFSWGKLWVNRSFVNQINIPSNLCDHFRDAPSPLMTGLSLAALLIWFIP